MGFGLLEGRRFPCMGTQGQQNMQKFDVAERLPHQIFKFIYLFIFAFQELKEIFFEKRI